MTKKSPPHVIASPQRVDIELLLDPRGRGAQVNNAFPIELSNPLARPRIHFFVGVCLLLLQ